MRKAKAKAKAKEGFVGICQDHSNGKLNFHLVFDTERWNNVSGKKEAQRTYVTLTKEELSRMVSEILSVAPFEVSFG